MRYFFRRGLRKGLLGGSRPWTVLWVVIAAVRILRRLLRDEPEVVYSEKLQPGQTLVISAKDREPKVIGA
jgi:hypothetical protein